MTVLTGVLNDSGGNPITGSLWLELSQAGIYNPGAILVTPLQPSTFTLTAGQITGPGAGPYTVYGNDGITPSTTWYALTAFDTSGQQVLRVETRITGASVDFGALPIAPTQNWVLPPEHAHNDLAGRSEAATHPASAISNTPAGGLASTTVQAALDELDSEKAPLVAPEFTGPVKITSEGGVLSQWDAYGTSCQLLGRRANGTKASPAALAANDLMTGIAARGYGSSGFAASGRGGIWIVAGENWTDVAQGCEIVFYVTRNGTTTIAPAIRITNDGRLRLKGGAEIIDGTGSPEGAVAAPVGSVYHRNDGGAGTSFYVKESGTGTTGWVAK